MIQRYTHPVILLVALATSCLAQNENSITMPCTVKSNYRVGVMSRLSGYVGEVSVDLGDAVKKGDVLLKINAPEIFAEVIQKEKMVESVVAASLAVEAELASVAAEYAAIEARTKLRESERNRMRQLVASGVMTKAKREESEFAYASVVSETESVNAKLKAVEARLAAAQADVEVARANLEHARIMAQYLELRAPFDGVVMRRNVDPGAYIQPPSGKTAMPLLQIEQIDKVRVVIMVPYASAGGVSVGSAVTLDGFRGRDDLKLDAKITRIAAGFDEGSRTMRAEIELDNQPNAKGQRALRAGDYGSATIQLKD